MTKVACHQPNFIPWFPFFYKMAMVDKFIILTQVQYEKGGYQNRYLYKDKWITKSVKHGMDKISNKFYADGSPLLYLNLDWIRVIKDTLGIEASVSLDSESRAFDSPTERLIFEIKSVGGTIYVTNPDAKDKYLNEDLMRRNGIEIEYCKVPKHLNIHVFEAFEKFGIDGTIKQLPKRELCAI